MLKKYIDKRIITLFMLSIFYTLFSVYVFRITNLRIHRGMVWNLFLAIIPLVISIMVLICIDKHQKKIAAVLGGLWLLFFPNAPYMITGFIHLSTINFYTSGEFDIISWLRLVHFGLGALLGIIIGMVSLYNIHRSLLKFKDNITVAVYMMIIFLLSGYAIYVGRLLRLNSWDVLKPEMLFHELISNFDLFALLSTLLFAFFIFFTYTLYYYFIHQE